MILCLVFYCLDSMLEVKKGKALDMLYADDFVRPNVIPVFGQCRLSKERTRNGLISIA